MISLQMVSFCVKPALTRGFYRGGCVEAGGMMYFISGGGHEHPPGAQACSVNAVHCSGLAEVGYRERPATPRVGKAASWDTLLQSLSR